LCDGLRYLLHTKGASGRARLVCMKRGPSVVLFAYAAPEQLIAEIEQALYRIFEFAGNAAAPSADHPAPSPQPQFSHNTAATQPAAPPPPPAAHAPVAVQNASPAPQSPPAAAARNTQSPRHNIKFRLLKPPRRLSLTCSIRSKKKARLYSRCLAAGKSKEASHTLLRRPSPLDRGSFPGRHLHCVRPHLPQNLCHFRDQMEGQLANTAAGTQLLNLNPSAQRVSDVYVANVAVRTFGALQPKKRLARPDMVDMLKSQLQEYRVPVTPKWLIAADELLFDCSRRANRWFFPCCPSGHSMANTSWVCGAFGRPTSTSTLLRRNWPPGGRGARPHEENHPYYAQADANLSAG